MIWTEWLIAGFVVGMAEGVAIGIGLEMWLARRQREGRFPFKKKAVQ